MKWTTYMMQYLTSILSLGSSSKIKVLEKRIEILQKDVEELTEKNKDLETNISDIAVCIQHLAASMTTFALQGIKSATTEDPLEALLSKEDEDKGYLH